MQASGTPRSIFIFFFLKQLSPELPVIFHQVCCAGWHFIPAMNPKFQSLTLAPLATSRASHHPVHFPARASGSDGSDSKAIFLF